MAQRIKFATSGHFRPKRSDKTPKMTCKDKDRQSKNTFRIRTVASVLKKVARKRKVRGSIQKWFTTSSGCFLKLEAGVPTTRNLGGDTQGKCEQYLQHRSIGLEGSTLWPWSKLSDYLRGDE